MRGTCPGNQASGPIVQHLNPTAWDRVQPRGANSHLSADEPVAFQHPWPASGKPLRSLYPSLPKPDQGVDPLLGLDELAGKLVGDGVAEDAPESQ